MMVSIFNNLHTAKPQKTSLEKIVHIIKTSSLLKDYTQQAREFYADGNKEQGDSIKKNLMPAFAPAGYLLDGKGRENLIGLTGLCFIDIDHISEEKVESYRAILREDEHVLLAARSISGNGLHIIVPYSLRTDNPDERMPLTPGKMNQTYCSVFKPTTFRYGKLLGVGIDKAAGHAERLCIISYDSAAWYNPAAVPIIYRYRHQKSGKKPKSFEEYSEQTVQKQ